MRPISRTSGSTCDYKRTLRHREPWRVIIVAIAASAPLGGFNGSNISSTPPASIIVPQAAPPAAR
jgi:hypothetical protein